MSLLPCELHLKIASYLEPRDLKSYALVSRQCRECALEYLVFTAYDYSLKNVMDAGARKVKLHCCDVATLSDPTLLSKVVELSFDDLVTSALNLHVFKNLTILDVSKCKLTRLPDLPPTLVSLNCSKNRLTQLPELPPTLVYLYCSKNSWTHLPALPVNLKILY